MAARFAPAATGQRARPAGTSLCGSYCQNLQVDNYNCGLCGKQCTGGTVCQSGSCQPCPAPTVDCSGRCVNLASDQANCGTCSSGCQSGVFVNGNCTCLSGALICNGVCTNIQ